METFSVKEIKLEGKNLIEASAGTGKTFSIALLFVRMILEGHPASEIVVVTFTKAATEELKSRITSFLKDAHAILTGKSSEKGILSEIVLTGNRKNNLKKIKKALLQADEIPIFTIHGFCHKLVVENSFECSIPFDINFEGEEENFIEQAFATFWRETFYNRKATEFLSKADISELYDKTFSVVRNYPYGAPDVIVRNNIENNNLSWEKEQINLFESSNEPYDPSEDFKIITYRAISEMPSRIAEIKRKNNTLTYNDLILTVYNTLKTSKGKELIKSVREKYSALMVDEFQDTDETQLFIFSSLFADKKFPIFYIGDPKQAVYSFRNADIFAYIKAAHDSSIPEDKKFTMNVNYRSSQNVLNGIETIFTETPNPFIYSEINFIKVKSGVKDLNIIEKNGNHEQGLELRYFKRENIPDKYFSKLRTWTKYGAFLNKSSFQELVKKDIVNEIIRLINPENGFAIDGKPIVTSNISILVRNGYTGSDYLEALRSKNIPAVLYSEKSVLETEAAEDITFFIKAVIEAKPAAVKRFLITPLGGMDEASIMAMEIENSKLESELIDFQRYREIWLKSGFMKMFFIFMREKGIKKRFLQKENGERALTDYIHIAEILHKKESEENKGIEEMLSFIIQKGETVSREEKQLRLETEESGVKIITMHKSKGLEFEIVFAPDLAIPQRATVAENSPITYHKDRKTYFTPFADKESIALKDEELTAEEIRLAYVAMTRASVKLYLHFGIIANGQTSPLFRILFGNNDIETIQTLDEHKLSLKFDILAEKSDSVKTSVIDPSENLDAISKNEQLNEQESKTALIFNGKIEKEVSITSFSALSKNISTTWHDQPGNDQFIEDEQKDDEEKTAEPPSGIFLFPKGPKPGTALHEIFENIEFGEKEITDIVENTLKKYSLLDTEKEERIKAVVETVKTILEKQLTDENIVLSELSGNEISKELEFYFKTENRNPNDISEIINRNGIPCEVNGRELKGFMHGFIDLVFTKNGKYYIVDWKSNYLGENETFYTRSKIEENMAVHNYHLQYLIYTLALNRYLAKEIENYSYDTNFGGVLYIFIRGVNTKNDNGIFFTKPKKELIEELDEIV